MQFLSTLKMIISLLPILVEAIKAIEAAMPGSGNGVAKLDAIKAMVQTAYTGASDAVGAFELVWPKISDVVAGIVASFNKSGMFAK